MLPDAEDFPAALPERAVHEAVTGFVPHEFVFPKYAPAGGLRSMFGATVPETAVHKNRELEFWKNEVRFAKDFLIPPPASYAVPTE